MHGDSYLIAHQGKIPKLFNEGLLEPILAPKPKSRRRSKVSELPSHETNINGPDSEVLVKEAPSIKRTLKSKLRSKSASQAINIASSKHSEFMVEQVGDSTQVDALLALYENKQEFQRIDAINADVMNSSIVVEEIAVNNDCDPTSQCVPNEESNIRPPANSDSQGNDVSDEVQLLAVNVKEKVKPFKQSKGGHIQMIKDRRNVLLNKGRSLSEKILQSPTLSGTSEDITFQSASKKQTNDSRPLSQSKMTASDPAASSSSCQVMAKSLPPSRNGIYRFIHGHIKLLADILQYNGFTSSLNNNLYASSTQLSKSPGCQNKEIDLLWCCHHVRGQSLLNLPPFKKINLFPHSYECTRKDALARNINLLIQMHGTRHFNFMPECYIWPQEKELIEKAMTMPGSSSSSNSRYSISGNNNNALNPWIIKPASSCQGKGIHIVNDFRDIEGRISEDELHIVERYVHNPLLLNKKKFDLRIYVLVTSFNPLKIYVHREGLVRRASEVYDFGNDGYENKFSHLTNYSINKVKTTGSCNNIDENSNENNIEDKEKSESEDKYGLKMSFRELNEWLKENGCEDSENIWKKIDDLIVKTLIVVEGKINTALSSLTINQDACFELFGFDVLIDDAFNPWLMEVNFAPSLATDSPLDFSVKSKVLTDMLNLVGLKKSNRTTDSVNKSSSSIAVSKFAVKKNLKSSLIASEQARSEDINPTNPLQNVCYFTFHDDFGLKDEDYASVGGELRDLTYPSEDMSLADDSKCHEKLATLRFRDEFVSSHDRKVMNEFLLEQLRAERSRNGFRLVYPSEGKYGQYHNLFSEVRYNNELLGRFVFYVHSYKEIVANPIINTKKKSNGKKKADTAEKRASSSRSVTSMSEEITQEITFQPAIWSQIHNKWARVLGRSTMNI